VPAFNKFLKDMACLLHGNLGAKDQKEAEELVAARLIGRWRTGEPLVPPAADSAPPGGRGRSGEPSIPAATDSAPPVRGESSGEALIQPAADSAKSSDRNDFLYYFEDRFGLACPIGAHIRRANPRDGMPPDPDTALRLSKMHRIIRRGRLYGERLAPDAEGASSEGAAGRRQLHAEGSADQRGPEAKYEASGVAADQPKAKREASDVVTDQRGLQAKGEAGQDGTDRRGIHFICLNADIAGQFEMIQHSWLNGTHFGGLHDEADPVSRCTPGDGHLTIQHRPTNMRISIPQFTKVRGGAYFFLPGIKALRSLAGTE
jgi:deferrochelatase/peroxidase EfeB